MTIIESWEKSKQQAVADTQKPDVTEGWRSMRHAAVTILSCCIAEFQDATTPRPPQSEWFGTGPGQWDAWWVSYEEGGAAMTFKGIQCRSGILIFPDGHEVWLDAIVSCVPVSREGFPAPVGWQVLEAKESA